MKCPTCVSAILVMSERLGVEIDYCPQCRGVWLGSGELNKLLEWVAVQVSPQLTPQGPQQRSERHQDSSCLTRQYETHMLATRSTTTENHGSARFFTDRKFDYGL